MPSLARTRILAALALGAVAAPLLAAPADVVRQRIAGLRELGAAFKNVNDSLRGGTPQPIIIQQSAREITAVARAMPRWFPAGTGPNPAWKTAAKPEIWTQTAQFRTAQTNFINAAAAFQRAAASNNADAIRSAARNLGGACKGCHDQFRAEEKI
jgi:cytochrome c556